MTDFWKQKLGPSNVTNSLCYENTRSHWPWRQQQRGLIILHKWIAATKVILAPENDVIPFHWAESCNLCLFGVCPRSYVHSIILSFYLLVDSLSVCISPEGTCLSLPLFSGSTRPNFDRISQNCLKSFWHVTLTIVLKSCSYILHFKLVCIVVKVLRNLPRFALRKFLDQILPQL